MRGATQAGRDTSDVEAYFALLLYADRGLWAVQRVPLHSATPAVFGVVKPAVFNGLEGFVR